MRSIRYPGSAEGNKTRAGASGTTRVILGNIEAILPRSAEYIRARKDRSSISWQVAGVCVSAEEAEFALGNWIASDAIKRWRAEH